MWAMATSAPAAPVHHLAESLEQELKLRLAPGTPLPSLELPGIGIRRRGVLGLHAVYHDTVDARLARAGVTLRRRTGGEDEGWHVKLAGRSGTAGIDSRLELHLPLEAGAVGAPPPELLDLVAALTRGAAVVPLAQVQTRRRVWELVNDDDAAPVAIVSDDGVVTTRIGLDGDLHRGEVFREVEVELVPGPDGFPHARAEEVVAELRRLLVDVGATPSPRSKGAQALGEIARGQGDVVVPAVPARPTALAVLRTAIASQVTRLIDADLGLRRGQDDAIHDVRVAARRLRSMLQTFEPVIDRAWAHHLRTELAWIAGAFDAARDTEVQLELLPEHAGALRRTLEGLASRKELTADVALVREEIDRALTARLAGATSEALLHLRSPRYTELLEALVAAAREPRPAGSGGVADRAGAVDSLGGDVEQLDAAAQLGPRAYEAGAELRAALRRLRVGRDPHSWHKARIRAKRARYAAEVLALVPQETERAWRVAARLDRATTLLGEIHDAHVSRALLRSLALSGDVDPRARYLIGVLDGVVAARERRLEKRFLAKRRRLVAFLTTL